jgi:hypothetical protein
MHAHAHVHWVVTLHELHPTWWVKLAAQSSPTFFVSCKKPGNVQTATVTTTAGNESTQKRLTRNQESQ